MAFRYAGPMLPDGPDGIDSPAEAGATRIYPNPTTGTIYLTTKNPIERVTLRDVSGRIVKRVDVETPPNAHGGQTTITADLSSGSPGIYFLEVQDSQKHRETFKIIRN